MWTWAVTDHRGPGEAGVEGRDRADFPAAQHLARQVSATSEKGQLPDSGAHQIMSDVVVRRTAFLPNVNGEGWVGGAGWVFVGDNINTFGPAIVRAKLQAFGKAARERDQQRVIVCGGISRREEHPEAK